MDNKIIDIDRLSRYHENINTLLTTKADKNYIEVKQDKIDDLDEIRDGAAKGKTALQSIPSEYITETELSNKGYATISALNNKVDAINGKQLSTEDFTTALKTKLEGLSNYDDTDLSNAIETLRGDFDNIVSGDTTTAIKTFNEVIAFLDGLTDTQDLESIIASIEQQIAGKMDKVTLASVATSGNYNDLSNKPTIPTKTSELENDSNYIANNTYETIICGEVITDHVSTFSIYGYLQDNHGIYGLEVLENGNLHVASQFSDNYTITHTGDGTKYLADDGTYKTVSGGSGTITGVSANGTSVATSGVANIPAASTSKYGVTKLSSSTSSTSTSLAATASAVKAAYDLANGKQDKLTSGTNIKTINGTSILGSGDINIETLTESDIDAMGFTKNTGTVQSVETSETLDEVNTTTYVKYVAQTLTDEQQSQSRKNINALTSYEYYVANGGVLNERQYNIMIKYLFTPFMISSNSTTIIPDELLNESKNNFFADWYWNVMRITGGEPIMTTQWKNNIPYKFKGIVNNKIYIIDFSNKTIKPEV